MNSQVAPPITDTHGVQDISFGLGVILRLSLICDFPFFYLFICEFVPVTAKVNKEERWGKYISNNNAMGQCSV